MNKLNPKNQYCIKDRNGKIVAKGFRLKLTAIQNLPKYRTHNREQLFVVKNVLSR